MENINFVLDLKKGRVQPFRDVVLQQFDKNCYNCTITIQNAGTAYDLTGKTIRVQGIKPDLKSILCNTTVVNAKEGTINLKIDEQMTVKAGLLKLQLLIFGANDFLQNSIPFVFIVGSSLNVGEPVVSTDDFLALTETLKTVSDWDRYFSETSGKIEEKYTLRLNEVQSSLDDMTYLINSTMTTLEIQKVLDNYRNVTFLQGDYTVGGLYFKNNTIINFNDGVIFNTITNLGTRERILNFKDVENITLKGVATIKFHGSYTGEQRHGVSIEGSNNIKIDVIKCYGASGDSVSIDGVDEGLRNRNISINRIYSFNAKRGGLVVVDVDNLYVNSLYVENETSMLRYTSGLHFEPYTPHSIKNININTVDIKGSTNVISRGLIVNLQQLREVKDVSINISVLNINNSEYPFEIVHLNTINTVKTNGLININNANIEKFIYGASIQNFEKTKSPLLKINNLYMSKGNINNIIADSTAYINCIYNNLHDGVLGNIIIDNFIFIGDDKTYTVVVAKNNTNAITDIVIGSIKNLGVMGIKEGDISNSPIIMNQSININAVGIKTSLKNSIGLNIDEGKTRGWADEYNNTGSTSDIHAWLELKNIGTRVKVKVTEPFYIKVSPNQQGETMIPDYVYPTKIIKSNVIGSYIIIEKINANQYAIVEKVGVWQDQ